MLPALSVISVRKIYDGDSKVLALEGLTFEVAPHEFVCIVGPSGCGKSTLVRILCGLDSDFQGKILVSGRQGTGVPSGDCGVVFQEPLLLPWMSVRENLLFASPQKTDAADQLLNLLELSGFKHALPSQISGGTAQKAALARALVNSPALLLLDEPLASIDALSRMRLQDELLGVVESRKASVVMVTHDVDEALYLSDRVLVMSPRPGRIVKEFRVSQQKPRNRKSKQLADLKEKILGCLRG